MAGKTTKPVAPTREAAVTGDPEIVLTPEELEAIKNLRLQQSGSNASVMAIEQMAAAISTAIERTRPPEKKTALTRKKGSPWLPKDGAPKAELKRNAYQHGVLLDADTLSNEEIELLNKVKPGKFCNKLITVTKRKDNGIDIDWPVRTGAQRLRLLNLGFAVPEGSTMFASILKRCIEERADPTKYAAPSTEDDD